MQQPIRAPQNRTRLEFYELYATAEQSIFVISIVRNICSNHLECHLKATRPVAHLTASLVVRFKFGPQQEAGKHSRANQGKWFLAVIVYIQTASISTTLAP